MGRLLLGHGGSVALESTLPAGQLVGRDAELAALRRAVEEGARSGRPLLLRGDPVLRGDPGVGKSALP
jgi:Cdc6-like AAA superfamily ATPase